MRVVLFRGGCPMCLWIPTCVLLALVGVGCGSRPAESRLSSTAPTVVHSGLDAEDSIDGLDLAVGPNGSVHLVWRERPGLYGTSEKQRIMYRRGRGDPLRWGPPMLVAEGVAGTPQVVARRDGVHVLAGFRLGHWWLPYGADRWQSRGALLDGDAPSATAFDPVTAGDSVVIAYISGGIASGQAVYALHWGGEEVGEPVEVAAYPARAGTQTTLIAPVLLARPNRLSLLWGAHVLAEVQRTSHTEFRSDGRVYAAWSDGAGRRWTQQAEVNADTQTQISLRDIATAHSGTGPLALFAAHGLFASQRRDGGWTPPRQLAHYDTGQLSGSARTARVVAAQCGGQPLVAWVDGRHQRSDKRWWNPLGGFPWSDAPDWINNDLFVLSGPQLAEALDGRPVQPQRQTAAGSYTEDVAVIGRGDHALLLWAGRADVEKSPDDTNSPPAILQRSIECG